MSNEEATNQEFLAAIKDLKVTVLATADDVKSHATNATYGTFKAFLWMITYALVLVAGTLVVLESLGLFG